MLTPEVREIVKEAALEAVSRKTSADDVFRDVVRLCKEATTPELVFELAQLFSRLEVLGRAYLGIPLEPAPEAKDEPEQTGPFGEVAWGQADPVTDPAEPVP